MMYNNKLACAIKVGGKVLREDGETVKLPFGSEYSFYVKNLHSKRAQVSISIDGEDIANGETFVVRANDHINIERFLRGNNSHGNRFKFIERTAEVEQHKGIGVADGLIRVEYQFEREIKPVITWTPSETLYRQSETTWADGETRRGLQTKGGTGDTSGMQLNSTTSSTTYSSGILRSRSASSQSFNTAPANEVGVTVEGSVSDQQFRTVASFPLETEKHVMVLRLVGQTDDNTPITKPVTTKSAKSCHSCSKSVKPSDKFCSNCGVDLTTPPPECTSCGKVGKYHEQFCTECGTSLTIIS